MSTFDCGWLWSLWRHFPNRIRFFFYRSMVHMFGQRLGWSSVFQLPFGLYVKLSRTPNEASAMEYVRTRTTIPVPAILDCPFHRWLIVMQASPGKPLQGPEGSRLAVASNEQLQNVRDGLTDWVNQLRTLSPPDPRRVSGFLGGGIYSFRIDEAFRPVGPFPTPAEFHSQRSDLKEYKIIFTHGDILPHNILADEDFHLTGLVDWECAGWMPDYWEKAMSLRAAWIRVVPWSEIVKDSFPVYHDDMILEQRIQICCTP
ncbi:hypothetical protein C8R41DRAFT_893308 [Lentinula lateritia]|uniref:Aminoglycoside phosphotransferase domain-containing protein n=1 Tax=Lentinula lateritia TaxID=40482 RepID=A0ABQ8VZ05_9AGAR|nr:hypothetical protein C8R41DRAFT_893308 [Lentinula lateritia]